MKNLKIKKVIVFNVEIMSIASNSSCHYIPVRIRVKIGPSHPHACRKRRLIGAVLRMTPEKPRSRVTAGVAR
jgi:hypothetical protein